MNQLALCGIAKNENLYLVEWAAYHLSIGFQHIYIYDNMSSIPIENLFDRRAPITVIRWPNSEHNAQVDAYRHFLNSYAKNYQDIMIMDIDEFIHIKKHESLSDLQKALGYPHCIRFNWRIFGSGGQQNYYPVPMIARFTECSNIDFNPNRLTKSLHRVKTIIALDIHHAVHSKEAVIKRTDGVEIENGFFVDQVQSSFDVAQVNHYFTKSLEEWNNKLERGYTDGTVREQNLFDVYNRVEVKDHSILNRFPKMLEKMFEIRAKEIK